MRIIEAEEKEKDADAQSIDSLKSAVIRLQKRIADLRVTIDDTKNSKQDDDKKKLALNSLQSQIESLQRELEGKRNTIANISQSVETKKQATKEEESVEREFYRYEEEYKELVEYCIKTDYGKYLYEGKIGDLLKSKLDFIKEIAIQMQAKLSDIIRVFINKYVFLFFSKIMWSLKKIYELAKQGFAFYSKIMNFLPDLAARKFFETKAGIWTKEKALIIEDWLRAHPVILKVSGILFAALLFYVWINQSLVGHPLDDFMLTDIVLAITGVLTIIGFFTSEKGFRCLFFLLTGALGLSFPYPLGTPIKCAIALIATAAYYLHIYIKKQKQKAADMDTDREAGMILARA